jgi:glycosyltransferase involved in cell wall biosynthesis
MKILMLSDVYFPRVNGVSTSIRTCARELVRRGHSVTIVAPDYPTAVDDGDDSCEIVRLSARTLFFDPEDRLIRAAAMRTALRDLTARRWDIIHVHTPFRAHQLGVRLGRNLGCPIVETYHTYFEEYAAHYLPWLPSALLRFGARRFSRRLCQDADHLIVPTLQMADVLARYGITTPHSVIPTGVPLDEFEHADGARFRRAHGIALEQPTLVTVSRLAAEKNIAFLLDVARALIDEFTDLVFVIAGEGPDRERLQQRALALGLAKHVRFVGNLERHEQLPDCYRAGDLFVFASPTETQGLVLIEAMSLGIPIVSTAVMGTATVLRDVRCARISGENVGEFANAVAILLRDWAERLRLASFAKEDARAWSAPVLMDQVERLYERLRNA